MKPIESVTDISARLGITVAEYEALLDVRMRLATGLLKHNKSIDTDEPKEGGFNMALWPDVHDCGTAACIGGSMERTLNGEYRHRYSGALHNVFFPASVGTEKWPSLTETQAVRAIDLFLAGDRDPWPKVVAEDEGAAA